MGLTAREPMPGVWHIEDGMGVCMTLLAGEERALLVDTGYGLEDVAAFVRGLTDRPLTVMLTHHHHDHALGARWFPETYMFEEDAAAFERYTGAEAQARVLAQAAGRGLSAQGEWGAIPTPKALSEGPIPLGGMTAHVLRCPGHTPGSAAVYVPERGLMLTGDAWNPCTWVFFPEALPVRAHLRNARRLLKLPFERVLCPHRPSPYPRETLERFLNGMTDGVLRAAEPVTIAPYEAIDTRKAALPDGQELVFDWAKAGLDGQAGEY